MGPKCCLYTRAAADEEEEEKEEERRGGARHLGGRGLPVGELRRRSSTGRAGRRRRRWTVSSVSTSMCPSRSAS